MILLVAVEGETRKIFEGIEPAGKGLFYVLGLTATAVFCWGWWQRVGKYRQGGEAHRLRRDGDRRPVGQTLAVIAANTTIAKRDRAMGAAHFFLFWGFITLFVGTVIITIDYDIFRTATRLIGGEEQSFFEGGFYVVYSFLLDTMGAAALLALGYMAVRRRLLHRPQLDYTRAETPADGYSRRQFRLGDAAFVGLLAAVMVTGFLEEGFRIRANAFPSFEVWSSVGWVLAKAVSGLGVSAASASTVHTVLWWAHGLLALAFVASIPFTKAMHMLTDAANLVAHDPAAARRLPPVTDSARPGYRELSDFTWKELLDLDACTKCGRCHEACPAKTAGAALSPRDVILDLRQWAEAAGGTHSWLDHEQRPEATGPMAPITAKVAGEVIHADVLWACTTCMACVEACPVGIEHVSTIIQLRRTLVDEGAMEPSLQTALQNIAQQGNSFGKSGRMRARWTKGLDVPVKDARKEPVELLWFVGDFASFDERLQELSRALARILTGAGVDFGLLYEDEWNAGNDVRRVGEEGLFELLVEHNMAAFGTAQFSEIFTTDPHSFNTLRNEYPGFGLEAPVRHYTEVLADLLEAGAIPVSPLGHRVTYHDPCYLARYNRQTDAPRRVLAALGCELVEMPRNRENTFCCGAGGGRIWMDDSGLSERPSENRIREAAALDVGRFVVACPKDFTMYSDAAKTTGHDEGLAVVDLVQLVEEAAVPAPLATVAGP
jgi:Fe-S oxidoreductase